MILNLRQEPKKNEVINRFLKIKLSFPIAAKELLLSSNHVFEEEKMEVEKSENKEEEVFVTMSHFERALKRIKSSVSDRDLKYYESMKAKLEKEE